MSPENAGTWSANSPRGELSPRQFVLRGLAVAMSAAGLASVHASAPAAGATTPVEVACADVAIS